METLVAGISEVKTMKRPSLLGGAIATPESKEVRKKIVYTLSEDQKELRAIRVRLGMTKHGFSKALDIKQCTLDSYEYGKTKGVPLTLMESARALEEKKKGSISSSREMFETKSMSLILGEWAEKLNIPLDNAAALGRLLNTTPTTIRRWRDNKVRPDISKLSKLAARVNEGPVGALKISAIYAVKKLRSDSAESKGSVFIPESAITLALQRMREVSNPSEHLVKLIGDFEATVGGCKKIAGDPIFIQMSSLSLYGFVRRFLGELSVEGIYDDDEDSLKPPSE